MKELISFSVHFEERQRKIAYVLVCYETTTSGVFKKIRDQVIEWRKQGWIVQLYVLTKPELREDWLSIDPEAVVADNSNLRRNMASRWNLIKNAQRGNPSVIYVRDDFPLRIVKVKNVPIVLEVQSRVGAELRLINFRKWLTFRILKNTLYKKFDAAIYVTSELLNLNEFSISGERKIVIGNGIDLNRILPTKSPPRKLSLFFIGQPNQDWHGVDELVEFAMQNRDIDVHIVGPQIRVALPNLFIYSERNYEQYQQIARLCTAGVGSLALNRKRMKEESSLKVREYLAFGLPVILKFYDEDVMELGDCCLKLADDIGHFKDASPTIRYFLESWSNRRVSRDEIMSIGTSHKEAIRLNFLNSLINSQNEREIY